MKKLLLLILLAINVPVNAQTKNVDLDNLYYSIAFRSMPKQMFNPMFFSYSVSLDVTKPTEQHISVSEIEESVRIEGQQRVNEGENADLRLLIRLGNLVIQNNDIVKREEVHKNKEGKVTSVSYYYTLVVTYTFESFYRLMQNEKTLDGGIVYVPGSTIKFQSQEYDSRRDAMNFWNNNREVLISDFITEAVHKTVEKANAHISLQYGFPVIETTTAILTMDEKKHLENEPFRAACNSLKTKFQAITPEQGPDKDELAGIIDYFQSIPAKYPDPKLKADVKLRYAAYFNLSRLYLYLEDFANAHKYADLLIQNGFDPKEGGKLKKTADEWKAMLERTKLPTRYFNPEDYFTE